MPKNEVKVKIYGDTAWWTILSVDQSKKERVYTIGRINNDGGLELDMVTFDQIVDIKV